MGILPTDAPGRRHSGRPTTLAGKTLDHGARREEDGGYCVHVPALRGCHTEGDDLPEALRMAVEAIECHLECLQVHGEPIPQDVRNCTVDVRDAREALIYKVAVRSPVPEPEATAVA